MDTATVEPEAAMQEFREERAALPASEDRRVSKLSPGIVSQELITALARKYTPEEMLVWCDELRNATFKGQPDVRTRLAAFKLMMEYMIGRPVERIENVNVNMDAMSGTEMVERLMKSPALREQLRTFLAEADSALSGTGRVIEAESVLK